MSTIDDTYSDLRYAAFRRAQPIAYAEMRRRNVQPRGSSAHQVLVEIYDGDVQIARAARCEDYADMVRSRSTRRGSP